MMLTLFLQMKIILTHKVYIYTIQEVLIMFLLYVEWVQTFENIFIYSASVLLGTRNTYKLREEASQ